jgi:non-specific serine/threonine protein kinase
VRGDAISLEQGLALHIDADEFAAAAGDALAHREIERCRAALALYAGEYLPDDVYEDWSRARRDELATLRTSVLIHQARLCAEEGDTAEARNLLSAVLAIDPAHEEAACRQMTLLAAIGERTEALRVFQRLRDELHDQYGLEPGDEVSTLAQNLYAHQAARTRHRAPATVRQRSNLPSGLTSFIGRQDAQTLVGRMLKKARLVALTGPGGSGKTRLALRVAELALHVYPDGVWLCELAGLSRPSEQTDVETAADPVTVAVASALGLVEDPGCRLVESVCAFLAPRRLLLVLDNCEHLIGPVAGLVAAVLKHCRDVTVLVTSQEALGLPVETTWAVPPLALPDAARTYTPERLGSFDAIRLFVERAQAARPGFALDASTAPQVADVCRYLEGIPLAIELAAARLAFLSLDVLAARMHDRFRLLVGGSRIALPRYQTLRAMMDWSYGLLGTKEQALLRRLTIFSGGWTLAAVEGVCPDEDLPLESILDTLGGLVAKSLITAKEANGEARYGMLETVREYGHAQLADNEQESVLRERHLGWFARYCENAIAGWGAGDQAALLRGLDAELENVRAALAWGVDHPGGSTDALRLASALSRFWQTRGLVGEGRRWTARALDAAYMAPKALRASAFNRCAILARLEGDAEAAGQLLEASLVLFRELEDSEGIARAAGNLGLLRYDRGDDVGAVEALSEGLALSREHGDQQDVPHLLLNLGMVYTRMKDYPEAEAALTEAGAMWQAAGDQLGLSMTLLNMAQLARDQHQLDRAGELYVAGLRTSVAIGDRPQLATGLEGVAHVLLRRSAGTHASPTLKLCAHLFACAASVRESTGVSIHATDHPQYQADLLRLRGLLGRRAFEAEWTRGWNMPPDSLIEQIPGLRGA